MACKHPACIDLHIHSTASDGTLTPLQIAALCAELGIKAISLTDHDSLEGCRELLNRGAAVEVEFMSGVEISSAPPEFTEHKGSLHILGYAVDVEDEVLNRELATLRRAREERNPAIIDKLNRLGFSCTLEEVAALTSDGQLGRPHIARLMAARGWVGSVDEAFDRYLKHGCPAYVDKYRLSSRRAIDIISGAGGIAILAHPGLLKGALSSGLEDLVDRLMEWGLKGIEAFYPEHTPVQTEYYLDLASRRDLLVSGGTDFHGDLKPEIRPGAGFGDMCIPYELFETLRDFAVAVSKGPENGT